MQDIDIVCDWLREPDNAVTFTTNDMVMWANERPTGEALAAKKQIEAQSTLITELVGALEAIYEADNTGPVAHEVNEKGKAVNWHNTKGRSAEIARAALSKAKDQTNDR
ncbi:hypothetical protein [Thalassospira povalilytica]|uniref:hypothetical protein n=1 Tax=Thalassospira povalilytica TaxID=732237 RepID=UPI003AA7FD04